MKRANWLMTEADQAIIARLKQKLGLTRNAILRIAIRRLDNAGK